MYIQLKKHWMSGDVPEQIELTVMVSMNSTDVLEGWPLTMLSNLVCVCVCMYLFNWKVYDLIMW